MSSTRTSTISSPRLSAGWGIVVAAWLAFMLVFGGVSSPNPYVLSVQTALSVALLGASLWRLRLGFPSRLAAAGGLLVGASLFLVLLHTLPIPFSLWASLPGRQLFVESFAVLGSKPGWLSLSLSSRNSMAAAMAFLPAVAAFFAALTIPHSDYPKLGYAVVGCAIGGLVIGLLQKSGGEASGLYFYGYADPVAKGTFGNRNFFASQLFTSIPFVAALAVSITQKYKLRQWLVAIFALVYMALLIAGLGAVGSRGGIVLAMLSVLLAVTYVYRQGPGIATSSWRWSAYALLISLVVIAQVGMVGVMRLADTDALDDFRGVIFNVTLQAIKAFFPVGSGFGTFVPVYQMFEGPSVIVDNYINHAHSDWLELLLEGGAPALLLQAGFIILFLIGVVSVSRLGAAHWSSAYGRAAVVVVFLMACHAGVDFALRTPALLSLFAVCCGLLCSVTESSETRIRVKRPKNQPTADPSFKSFERPKRGFGSNRPPTTA
jgi:O-antigen ligase